MPRDGEQALPDRETAKNVGFRGTRSGIGQSAGALLARSEAVLLLFGATFLALAWTHGPRLDDDSYAHFALSVQTIANLDWRALVTDTWNKPLTTLVYGTAGFVGGLGLARSASVALTILAAALLRRVLEQWLGWTTREHRWFVPAYFLLQIGLLPQVFLTMTEQLAAALLAGALYAWVRGKPWAAFLIAGFMPWARIESLFVVAVLFTVMSRELLRGSGRRALARVALMNVAGALPFLAWWASGVILEGKPGWMSASYAYLRDPFWSHLLSTNAVTGLCGALVPGQLLLVALGLLAWRAAPRGALRLPMLVLPAAAHLLFASLMVVYPRGSGYGAAAIAALNARSYTTVAPLLCLLAGWGWQRLFGNPTSAAGDRQPVPLWPSVGLTALLCLGFAAFQGSFPMFSPMIRIGYLALGLGALSGAAVIARSLSRHEPWRAARIYAWLTMASAPVMVPFFWYPLSWQDRQVEVQRTFLRELRRAPEKPPLVVQSLNGRLAFFGDGVPVPMPWIYPALVGGTAETAPAGAWIVLNTDERGSPVGYPREALRTLQDSGVYGKVGAFVDTRPRPAWQRAVDRLTPRNRGGGWIIFRKLAARVPRSPWSRTSPRAGGNG